MSQITKEIEDAVFGKMDYPPIINFYDHPVADAELTEKSGRPRFKAVTYVSIKPTHPDLSVRDWRSRAIVELDKRQYAPQWAKYLEAKDRVENRNPSIEVLPGMTVEAFAELKALQIYDCKALSAYNGDLSPYGFLKTLATQIMELSDEHLRKERDAVRIEENRPEQHEIIPDRASAGESGETSRSQTRRINIQKGYGQEENFQKENREEKSYGFTYSITV